MLTKAGNPIITIKGNNNARKLIRLTIEKFGGLYSIDSFNVCAKLMFTRNSLIMHGS